LTGYGGDATDCLRLFCQEVALRYDHENIRYEYVWRLKLTAARPASPCKGGGKPPHST
jgi:hypothetical protein